MTEIGTALVLLFDVSEYDRDKLMKKTPDDLYGMAQQGVVYGKCDIYTLEDFCEDINDENDCFEAWFAYPYYTEKSEHDQWYK